MRADVKMIICDDTDHLSVSLFLKYEVYLAFWSDGIKTHHNSCFGRDSW